MLPPESIAATLLAERLPLTAYFAGVTRDYHLAEDVFQEVSVKAVGRAAEFETPAHLIDPKAEGKPGALCQWGKGRTVRTQRWRLVERRDGSRELYDHAVDSAEYENVIVNPEHTPLVERLHGMLEAEFGKMGKVPVGKAKQR